MKSRGSLSLVTIKGVEVGAKRRRLVCEKSLAAWACSTDMLLANILEIDCLDELVLVEELGTSEATTIESESQGSGIAAERRGEFGEDHKVDTVTSYGVPTRDRKERVEM